MLARLKNEVTNELGILIESIRCGTGSRSRGRRGRRRVGQDLAQAVEALLHTLPTGLIGPLGDGNLLKLARQRGGLARRHGATKLSECGSSVGCITQHELRCCPFQ